MEITINTAWIFVACTFILGAYFAGHFRGWMEANKDFYKTDEDNE